MLLLLHGLANGPPGQPLALVEHKVGEDTTSCAGENGVKSHRFIWDSMEVLDLWTPTSGLGPWVLDLRSQTKQIFRLPDGDKTASLTFTSQRLGEGKKWVHVTLPLPPPSTN